MCTNLINSVFDNLRNQIKKLVNPIKLNGAFIKELQRLVSPKAEGQLASPIKFTEFRRKILDLICSSPGAAVDAHKWEIMVIKLRKDPVARSRLENIHAV